MHTSLIIFGNGTLSSAYLKAIQPGDYLIGVDRAAYWLLTQGITPDLAIGDFDSVTPTELKEITAKVKNVETFPPEKNFTDMELALEYAKKMHPKRITIYGGVGSRLDHSLGNILLLEQMSGDIRLVNETNEIRLVEKTAVVERSKQFRYVSVLSVTDETVISLQNFLYELDTATIKRGQTIGISNEVKGERGTVTVHQGKVLVIQSRD